MKGTKGKIKAYWQHGCGLLGEKPYSSLLALAVCTVLVAYKLYIKEFLRKFPHLFFFEKKIIR